MTERPIAEVLPFRELPHQNPFFTRAYWIFDALYDLTEAQAENLKQLDRFKIEWEELTDGNEIVTLNMFEESKLTGARPTKIYKVPEYASGREYIKKKNTPKALVETTWVELNSGDAHKEFHELLYGIEEALGFGTAQVTNIDQGFVRTRVMNPYISKTIRSMIGVPRQKVVNAATKK